MTLGRVQACPGPNESPASASRPGRPSAPSGSGAALIAPARRAARLTGTYSFGATCRSAAAMAAPLPRHRRVLRRPGSRDASEPEPVHVTRRALAQLRSLGYEVQIRQLDRPGHKHSCSGADGGYFKSAGRQSPPIPVKPLCSVKFRRSVLRHEVAVPLLTPGISPPSIA
jgi:hypothetical protein